MPLSLIAAVAKNNCIGKGGTLPWHLPEDLKHFKELTLNKTVVMGRKTWESLPPQFRPLPKRLNIVITRQADYAVPAGVETFSSVAEAEEAHPNEELMIIGGGEIYRATINQADTLYITRVKQVVEGDAFFPTINAAVWKEAAREDHEKFSFVTYKK